MAYENFYATRLYTDIGASDTTITLETAPSVTEGRLVLEARNSTKREIISFTGVSGNDITGVTRGVGGTNATTHTQNSLVEMNVTAEDLTDALNVPDDIITRFNETVSDHIASGLIWSDDTGLTADMSAGVAYINGIRLPVDAVSNRAFTASKDTYVDLGDNGVLDYNEVANGAGAPALAASHIRLARVVTSATDTTSVTNYGAPASLKKADGWQGGLPTPDTVTYNGNRSYNLVFNGTDLTDTVSNGMRLRATRTVTPPTQCTDLEASSSQYWSKTSPAGTTFTDDFCVGAWINLESYTGASQVIISRYNGTSGWLLYINSSGQVLLQGNNASGSNYSRVVSYQSIPLNKWVHVAAQLDMSAFTSTTTTSYIMIDGVGVPASVERAGTNPTALVQAGNLEVGSYGSGTAAFDGKIAQAWYSSAKITQANIVTFISQGMTGSETSIVSHFDFNGDGNDNNANANNLTAQASAGFTTDSPFNSTEYGIITANSFSTDTTLTVQVPEGYAIPKSGGVSAVAYSTQQTPYGFPADKGKWEIIMLGKTTTSTASTSLATLNRRLTVPIGSWSLCLFSVEMLLSIGAATGRLGKVTLSSDGTTETNPETTVSLSTNVTTSGNLSQSIMSEKAVLLTSATSYTLMGLVGNASNAISLGTNNLVELHYIKARFTYV